jgi:hypothetical protein
MRAVGRLEALENRKDNKDIEDARKALGLWDSGWREKACE